MNNKTFYQYFRVFVFTLILMCYAGMASALNANRGNALDFDGSNEAKEKKDAPEPIIIA